MHAVAAAKQSALQRSEPVVYRTVESTAFDRDDGVLYRRERSPTAEDHGWVDDQDLGYRPE